MTGGSESWLSWVFKFANFAILVAILVKYAGKPFNDYFANKHQQIKEKVDEAGKLFEEAKALKTQYETKYARLDEEIEAFKKAVLEETENEKKKILDEASEFASRIREQAKITYEQEIREVKNRIKEDLARLTIEKAQKLVMEKLTKDDHNKMVEEFIEKLRSLN
jgi:F-type H+-transporting ATPase subunit b